MDFGKMAGDLLGGGGLDGMLDQLKQGGVNQIVDMAAEQFGLPDSLATPLKQLGAKLDMNQLGDLGGALNALQQGDYNGAFNAVSGLVQQAPQEGVLYWLRGAAAQFIGPGDAAADLAKAQQLDGNLPGFDALKGLIGG